MCFNFIDVVQFGLLFVTLLYAPFKYFICSHNSIFVIYQGSSVYAYQSPYLYEHELRYMGAGQGTSP